MHTDSGLQIVGAGALSWRLDCVLCADTCWLSFCCRLAGHTCSMAADGFYVVSYSMVVLGLVLGCVYMRLFPKLISLQLHHWRAKHV